MKCVTNLLFTANTTHYDKMANAEMDAVVVGLGIGSGILLSFIIFVFTFRSQLGEEDTTPAYRTFILSIWVVSVILIYRRLPIERWVQALGEQ